jgi:hypothetical protein
MIYIPIFIKNGLTLDKFLGGLIHGKTESMVNSYCMIIYFLQRRNELISAGFHLFAVYFRIMLSSQILDFE